MINNDKQSKINGKTVSKTKINTVLITKPPIGEKNIFRSIDFPSGQLVWILTVKPRFRPLAIPKLGRGWHIETYLFDTRLNIVLSRIPRPPRSFFLAGLSIPLYYLPF